MNFNDVAAAYQATFAFNDVAEQFKNVTKESLALQLDLLQEEYIETVDAFDLNDQQEILDGGIDMFVIVCGFLQKLQAQGYDVARGLKKVTDNNLSKFIDVKDENVVVEKPEKSWTTNYNPKYKVVVLKDTNGKIRKPADYVSVDLSDCVPKVKV